LGCDDYNDEYYRLAGADGSIGENRVFEDIFSGVDFYAEAISAIKALQITNDRDLRICKIVTGLDDDCPDWDEYCPYNWQDRIEGIVNGYLANYDTVYMPEMWNSYGPDEAWEGYGMLALDIVTGRGAYAIAGKMIPSNPLTGEGDIYFSDGGGTVCRWPIGPYPDFFCTNVSGTITIDPPSPGDLYCAESEDYLTFTVPAIHYLSHPGTDLICNDLGTETNRQCRVPYTIKEIAENPEMGPGVYTFVVGVRGLNGLCDGSCQTAEKSFTIFNVEIKNPHGDPEADPGDAGANFTNEVIFSPDYPASNAYVDVFCEAEPDPDTAELRAYLEDNRIRWTVTEIDGSSLSWDSQWPGTTDKGEGIDPIATFTGMPGQNSSFGLKQVKMELMDGGQPISEKTTNIQVFFPRDESNNPGGNDPNWFYYWSQVYVNGNVTYDATLDAGGITPGGAYWSYYTQPDKDDIVIGNWHPGEWRSYEVGREFSGIDRFVATVIHEEKHVDQIQRADPLVPSSGDDTFRYGWSWGTYPVRHNHWSDPNNKWGKDDFDDDGDSIEDNARPEPPFEPGWPQPNGDPWDVSLEHQSWQDWPNIWPLPNPMYPGVHPIEAEAINHSDNTMPVNPHYYGEFDWGDKGKQHRTNDNWDD
ncbi:MAG: hypothetical protein JSU85_05515, partial [Candidatus Zixiibacteriota bacterium]